MAIVTSKLVSAAMLQDFIIGKDAQPLAAGIITMYKDNDHSTLKNWYYQTGVAGAYTYVALPNPMVLTASGTMQDVNGNDIIPFYYPWNELDSSIPEPYFVTVYNANGQLQFTRSGFPFVAGTGSIPSNPNFVTQENYIINNRFWRNVGSLTPSSGNATTWTTQYNSTGSIASWRLCPDQHDGFSMPDINYLMPSSDVGNATETITFSTFPATFTPTITNDIQPEYYIRHQCTGDSGTYTKTYQFPISLHLATLANQPFTFTMQANGAINLTVSIYSFSGTGNASPIPVVIKTFSLISSWNKYSINSIFPSNLGLPSSLTSDDAFYLQLSFGSGPVDFSFAIPSIYIYDDPTASVNGAELFSFSTYDQIDTVVAAPRTGDVKISMNPFYPFGWVPLSGGTLANIGSVSAPSNLTIAYQGLDAWPLYNLLWTTFSPYTLNSTELLQIYNSGGSTTTFGASANADWLALKQITLNQVMGQVLMGTVPVSALTKKYKTTFSGSSTTITPTNTMSVYNGMPVYFTGTSTLSVNTIYYVGNFTGTTFQVFLTYATAITQTSPQNVDASGTVVAAFNGTISGEYAHTQSAAEVGVHNHPAFSGNFLVNSSGDTFAHATGAFAFTTNTITGNNTGGNAFNVTQPSTFFNMFMKL